MEKKTGQAQEQKNGVQAGGVRSCVDCGTINCRNRDKTWPEFCLTTELTEEEVDELMKLYTEDEENARVMQNAAAVESDFYCMITRVEEIVEFAKRIGAKKIGIATCSGLIDESRIFARILRLNGFEVYAAVCKVGSIQKSAVGIPEEHQTVGPIMCNPILQAKKLNKAKTDLNVVVGLCVGHDSLFYKYAEGLCTTLITKDRVLGHNPAAALYQVNSYYSRLLKPRE